MRDGGLLSDRAMLTRGGPVHAIGMSGIKQRRLEELAVHCHIGTKVGDYVPFYFCPRSVMLYVIHCANHPELSYRGGQEPIVHLEADLHTVVQWANANGVRWAFSLSNAGAYYTEFCETVEKLDQLDWNAITSRDFRDLMSRSGSRPSSWCTSNSRSNLSSASAFNRLPFDCMQPRRSLARTLPPTWRFALNGTFRAGGPDDDQIQDRQHP